MDAKLVCVGGKSAAGHGHLAASVGACAELVRALAAQMCRQAVHGPVPFARRDHVGLDCTVSGASHMSQAEAWIC